VLSSSTYDAYGSRAGNDASGDPYGGFGGQYGYYLDAETGLYLLGMRYYDPGQGRFLNRDPMGYAAGQNLYRYCHNDPMDGIDPMGLDDGPSWGDFLRHEWLPETGKVFVGYYQAAQGLNPVGMWNGAVALYTLGHECGVGAAASALGNGLLHSYTDWATTSDPTKFGNSFGNVLIAVASAAAPKATCLGAFGQCFAAGTPVQMADGTTRRIEEVRPGDAVMSRDPQTGRTEPKRVLSTSKRWAGTLLTLHLADSTGKVVQELTCTPEHRFAIASKGQGSQGQATKAKSAAFTLAGFDNGPLSGNSLLAVMPSVAAPSAPSEFVPAGKLAIGTSIQTRAGPCLTVQSVTKQERRSGYTVYNFVVEDDHTYFVGTAQDGVWTHNAYTNVELQSIADEVQAALPEGAQSYRTAAATETSDGTLIVGGSRQYLTLPQQEVVDSYGGSYAKGIGHAEVTTINYGEDVLGLDMSGSRTAASRPICPSCASAINSAGGIPISPLK